MIPIDFKDFGSMIENKRRNLAPDGYEFQFGDVTDSRGVA